MSNVGGGLRKPCVGFVEGGDDFGDGGAGAFATHAGTYGEAFVLVSVIVIKLWVVFKRRNRFVRFEHFFDTLIADAREEGVELFAGLFLGVVQRQQSRYDVNGIARGKAAKAGGARLAMISLAAKEKQMRRQIVSVLCDSSGVETNIGYGMLSAAISTPEILMRRSRCASKCGASVPLKNESEIAVPKPLAEAMPRTARC